MAWKTAVTDHVTSKIRALRFANRDYLDDLIVLENGILLGVARQFAAGYRFGALRIEYPADAALISDEVEALRSNDRERLKQLIDRKRRLQKDARQRRNDMEREMEAIRATYEAEELEQWLAAGGRPDR